MFKIILPAVVASTALAGTAVANERFSLNDDNRNRAIVEELRDVTMERYDANYVYFRSPDGQRVRAPLDSVLGVIDANGDRLISAAEAEAAQRRLAR